MNALLLISALFGLKAHATLNLEDLRRACAGAMAAPIATPRSVRSLISAIPVGLFPVYRQSQSPSGLARTDDVDAVEIRRRRCGPFYLHSCMEFTFFAGTSARRTVAFSTKDRNTTAAAGPTLHMLARTTATTPSILSTEGVAIFQIKPRQAGFIHYTSQRMPILSIIGASVDLSEDWTLYAEGEAPMATGEPGTGAAEPVVKAAESAETVSAFAPSLR